MSLFKPFYKNAYEYPQENICCRCALTDGLKTSVKKSAVQKS